MKGIIVMVTIALATAIGGGAANGQTQEEVNEIIREAKQIGIADLDRCRTKEPDLQMQIAMHIRVILGPPRRGERQPSHEQIKEAVCRMMKKRKKK